MSKQSRREWKLDGEVIEAATEAPWETMGGQELAWKVFCPRSRWSEPIGVFRDKCDARFAARAREGWPAARAEVERLIQGIRDAELDIDEDTPNGKKIANHLRALLEQGCTQ